MADLKISELNNLTGADPILDMLPIVDVSATPPASGSTKRISINNLLSSSPTASGALTVTGLVTAGSATITGDLTVDTSVLKVDSTNNRVGIGTATPASALSFPIGTVTAVGMTAATAHQAGNAGTLKFGISDGGADFAGMHVVNSHGGTYSSQDLLFFTGEGPVSLATERVRITRSGNVGVGVTPSGTGGCLQLKSGITFPATQVASADANTLDDYEEGTWTPTLTFATPGTLAVTYSQQTGNYTKVGNLITARYSITINIGGLVIGTASGGLKITGLPFTVSGTGTQYVDLSTSLTDQTSGSLVISYPSTTLINFEQTQVSGTRIVRAGALVSASNFAAVNTGVISLQAVVTYTV